MQGGLSMKVERFPVTRLPRLLAGAALSLAALALLAGPAQACEYPEGTQAFSAWNDHHSYVLAPDGDFEAGGTGWTPSGGAAAVGGSLSLPEGISALSPPICTDRATHLLRLLASNSGDPAAALEVDVVNEVTSHPAGAVVGGEGWEASPKIPLGSPPGSVQVLLTAAPGSAWLVDDVYVDPFARH
jgi:hypothetical protein